MSTHILLQLPAIYRKGKNQQKETSCTDCQLRLAVLPCEHCKVQVCGQCFSEHIKLSMELNMTLKEVKEKVSMKMSDEKRELMENSKVECMKQLQYLRAFRSQKMREFFRTSQRLENFMEMISRVHDEILETSDNVAETESYLAFLAGKADRCTTIDSLKYLRKDAGDLRTVIRLLQDSNDHFRFIPNTASHNMDTLGHIEIGQAVVHIQGSYEADSDIALEELVEIFKVDVTLQHTDEGLETSGDDHDATLPAEDNIVDPKAKITSSSEAESGNCTASESPNDFEPSIATLTQQQPASEEVSSPASGRNLAETYHQNQLPSNVNYRSNNGQVTVLEVGELTEGKHVLIGTAYHVDTGRIYVTDLVNDRILEYTSDGQNASVFCKVTQPLDVAISYDGAYIYIASEGQLAKVEIGGQAIPSVFIGTSDQLSSDCLPQRILSFG